MVYLIAAMVKDRQPLMTSLEDAGERDDVEPSLRVCPFNIRSLIDNENENGSLIDFANVPFP